MAMAIRIMRREVKTEIMRKSKKQKQKQKQKKIARQK